MTFYTKKFLISTLTTSGKTWGIELTKYEHLCNYLCHWHLKALMLKPIQYRRCQIWLRQNNPIKTGMSETRGLLLRLIWLRRFKQLAVIWRRIVSIIAVSRMDLEESHLTHFGLHLIGLAQSYNLYNVNDIQPLIRDNVNDKTALNTWCSDENYKIGLK